MNPYVDPYAALGVTREASQDEIKSAYFKLVREHPPERDPEAFKTIRASYERVNTPEKRTDTDMRLLRVYPLPAQPAGQPALDLGAHREDLVALAQSASDLARTDFRDDFRKVKL